MSMEIRPYDKFSCVYSQGWGSYSPRYATIIYRSKEWGLEARSIWDVSCGTGNLLERLQEDDDAGRLDLAGSDISEPMLEQAGKRIPTIPLTHGDMATIDMGRTFDLIVCAFDSINYMQTASDVTRTFHNIYRHLRPNGLFLFDFNTPELFRDLHNRLLTHEYDGIVFRHIMEWEEAGSIAVTIFDFGDGEPEIHRQRAYTYAEMEGLVYSAGFEIAAWFDGSSFRELDFPPYGVNKPILVVRRAADDSIEGAR
jgi:SAM-dependent methyltransferase